MDDTIFEQLMDIRESGEVNMLDVNGVQRLAYESGSYESWSTILKKTKMLIGTLL